MVKKLIKSIFFKNKDYEEICCLQNIKRYFWQINWFKTIWFNFKALPFKKAIKLPFIISYNCKINNIGLIVLKNKIFPGMISIGVVKINSLETNEDKVIFTNYGKIIFNECPHVTKLAKFKLPSCSTSMFWNTLCRI